MTDTEKIATEILYVSLEPFQCNRSLTTNDELTEMYSEADPPLDFQGVIDGDIDVAEDWYTQHVLSGERQRNIVNEYHDKYELTNREKAGITMTCILDYGPATPNDGENE